jgi:hypothetical protein
VELSKRDRPSTLRTVLVEAFDDYDHRGDGCVAYGDLALVLRKLGLDLVEETLQALAKLYSVQAPGGKGMAVDYERLVDHATRSDNRPTEAPTSSHDSVLPDQGEAVPAVPAKEEDGGKKGDEASEEKGDVKSGEKKLKESKRPDDDRKLPVNEPAAPKVTRTPWAPENASTTVQELLCLRSQALDTPDKHGRTALHIAAANARLEAVRCLISQGASQEKKTAHGETALGLAWHPLVQRVLKSGESFFDKASGESRQTIEDDPLRCHVELVSKLGSAGIAVSPRSISGKGGSAPGASPAQLAECMSFLVENGFQLSEPLGRIDCRTPLHVAVVTSASRVVRHLLEQVRVR